MIRFLCAAIIDHGGAQSNKHGKQKYLQYSMLIYSAPRPAEVSTEQVWMLLGWLHGSNKTEQDTND